MCLPRQPTDRKDECGGRALSGAILHRLRYKCRYGRAPGPSGEGRVAVYEVVDSAGDLVGAGKGEVAFPSGIEALEHAFLLGGDALRRLRMTPIGP